MRPVGLELAHHLLERAAHAARPGRHLLALLTGAIIGDLAGARFALDHRETVAGLRRAVEAEHLDRRRRAGSLTASPAVGQQRADAAPFGAGHDDVAAAQRAALDQHGRHRTAAAIELGLDHRAFGRTFRVGLEVEHFGLQPDGFEQPVEIDLLGRRHLDVEHVAAHQFDLDLVLEQLGPDPLGLGVRLVDLVDGDDDRNLRRLGVLDRLDRLRHHAVIGRDHQHHDVGDLGAAGAHRRERLVARRIDEGDLRARRRRHLVGADVLGDAAGFAARHVGGADGVEQRGLAVVDVAHDGHDRRARHEVGRVVGLVEQALFDVELGDAAHRMAEFLGDQLGGVGVDDVRDLEHLPLLHEQLDHVDGTLGHAVGEFLDGDGLRDRHLADELLFGLVGGMPLGQALHAAAERRHRALAFLAGIESRDDREPAALLLGSGPRRLRRGDRPRDTTAGSADGSRRLFLVGLLDGGPHIDRRGGGRCRCRCRRRGLGLLVLAEPLLGFGLGPALGLVVVAAPLVLVVLARLGGVAFHTLAGFALVAAARLFFGDLALFGLADLGVGKGMGAGAALFFGQRAQHDARRLSTRAAGLSGRRRGPAAARHRGATRRRRRGRRRGLRLRVSPGPTMRRFTFSTTTCLVRPWLKL